MVKELEFTKNAILKKGAWASSWSKAKKADVSQYVKFAKLLWHEMKNGKILTSEEVGILIQSATSPETEITRNMIGACISHARWLFIKDHNETILWVSRQGYKIAQGAEKPLYVSKLGHQALKLKYRFLDSTQILSDADKKIAGAEIVARIKADMGETGAYHSDRREKLFNSLKANMDNLRIEAKNAEKSS